MNKDKLEEHISSLLTNNPTVYKKDLITFYWTRKKSSLLLNLLNEFTKEGDLIFDPFLGSAPILFSLDTKKSNLGFVGCEINEMPIAFIKFNIKQIGKNKLVELKDKIEEFSNEYMKYYEYENHLYNHKSTISKLIIDRIDNQVIVNQFHFTDDPKSVLDSKANDKIFKLNSDTYLKRCCECFEKIKNKDTELVTNSRIAIKSGMMLSNLFNPINFYVLKKYSEKFKNDELMITILSSVLHLCRLTDLKSQSQFPYWVPDKNIIERNVLLLLTRCIDKIIKSKEHNTLKLDSINSINKIADKKKPVLIINKAIQTITNEDIPDKTFDLVITDPPYFDQVAYSEYLKIWEYFCFYKSNLKDEVVFSNRKIEPSNEELYIENLKKSFIVVKNKLKDDGLVIIFFKDSKPKNIHIFLKVMGDCGLNFIRSLHIGNKKYTYKQNTTQETTVSGECLFFFDKITKNKELILPKEVKLNKAELDIKLNDIVYEFTNNYLRYNHLAELGELYDNGLLYELYINGLLPYITSSKTIVDILNKNFNLLYNRNYTN